MRSGPSTMMPTSASTTSSSGPMLNTAYLNPNPG